MKRVIENRTVTVNIVELLEGIENRYRTRLKSTIDIYETKDEVDEYTFDDYLICKEELTLLHRQGLLHTKEFDALVDMARDIRINVLIEEKIYDER